MGKWIIEFETEAPYTKDEAESIADDIKTTLKEIDGDVIDDSFMMSPMKNELEMIEKILNESDATLTVHLKNPTLGLDWTLDLSEVSDSFTS